MVSKAGLFFKNKASKGSTLQVILNVTDKLCAKLCPLRTICRIREEYMSWVIQNQ